MTGDWRRLHNEELHDFHFSTDIAKEIKWKMRRGVSFVVYEREEKCIQDFGGESRRKGY